jgi:leucyl-tRNA synthetase
MLRITAYADRLLADLDEVDWPESVKAMQREWIGRSEGAEIDFPLVDHAETLRVYTTRPDTLYGATFMVVAPEHPLVDRLTTDEHRAEVEGYRRDAARKSELQRTDLAKEKTGVFTGSYAQNPLLDASDPDARIPIWVADYVLMSYGTGAIMCVPGHDERDYEFARTFDLPVRWVVMPVGGAVPTDGCTSGDGVAVNSPAWNDLLSAEAKERATGVLEERGLGERRVHYRLRDWLFSRQRYWGEPFPVLHKVDGTHCRVPDDGLPVTLPPMDDFRPPEDGSPPLSKATDWVHTTHPETGEPVARDTDTMPGWAGSCWYYLRFMDPKNDEAPFGEDAVGYWKNVDLYIGGTEHAVLHLLYARFWHKVLYDEGLVPTKEPFQHLFNQGMLTAFAYRDPSGRTVAVDEVDEARDPPVLKSTGEPVERIVAKMSKTLKNVENPDDVCAEYGVDTFRLYEMFMGPLAESAPWNPRDIPGCRRFLERAWRVLVDPEGTDPVRPELADQTALEPTGDALELERALNRCLQRVDDSFEHFNFNTAIAAFMTFVNEAMKRLGSMTRSQAVRFVGALAPFAPHFAEEIHHRMGFGGSVATAPWPAVDRRYLEEDEVELAVQIRGKLRARIRVSRRASREDVEAQAREAAARWLEGKTIRKTVVVLERLVNFVTD